MKLFNSYSGSCWLGLVSSGVPATVVPSADPPDAKGGFQRAALATAVPHAKPHRDALHADSQGKHYVVRVQARLSAACLFSTWLHKEASSPTLPSLSGLRLNLGHLCVHLPDEGNIALTRDGAHVTS